MREQETPPEKNSWLWENDKNKLIRNMDHLQSKAVTENGKYS